MPDSVNNNNNDNTKYVRDLARRAFRNISNVEERAIEKVEKSFEPQRSSVPRSGFAGIYLGLAAGVAVCAGAAFLGIPFNRVDTIFIAAQFGVLGGLMFYINS